MSERSEQGGGRERASGGGGFWEQVGTIGLAVLIALGIRAVVIEPFRIPSGSMFPTLLIGDHLFVNKFVYGAKLPFTDVRLPALREPRRGDVIVFTVAKGAGKTVPADLHPELPTEEFVKRIVGLPGDEIEYRGSEILVNGRVIPTTDLGETFEDPTGRGLALLEEDLDGRSHWILDDPDSLHDARGTTVVPEGRYFVLGDNRDHSQDSRYWGTVRLAEIKGPAFILYWSWEFNGGWAQVVNPWTWWVTPKRWDRIGQAVR